MKTFGLVVPKGKGRIFEANVRRLLDQEHALAAVVLPLLEAWRAILNRAAELDRLPPRKVRDDANCRRLMTAPGIGAVVAASYVAAIESPANFKHARDVGAWAGLTPRDSSRAKWTTMGISRGGETTVARAALRGRNRDPDPGALCQRAALLGSALKKRLGFKRAAVALARKLAVVSMSCGRPERTSIQTTGSLPRDRRSDG